MPSGMKRIIQEGEEDQDQQQQVTEGQVIVRNGTEAPHDFSALTLECRSLDCMK